MNNKTLRHYGSYRPGVFLSYTDGQIFPTKGKVHKKEICVKDMTKSQLEDTTIKMLVDHLKERGFTKCCISNKFVKQHKNVALATEWLNKELAAENLSVVIKKINDDGEIFYIVERVSLTN